MLSIQNQRKILEFGLQSVLILVAPVLISAAIYMTLRRLFDNVPDGAQYSPVRSTWITKLFILGDLICFCVQGAGGSLASKADAEDASKVNLGTKIILAGLILQLVVIVMFVAIMSTWHWRIRPLLAGQSQYHSTQQPQKTNAKTKTMLRMLYLVSAMVMSRNTVRAVEMAQGLHGYIMEHEWVLYALDAGLMFGVLMICLGWYWLIRPCTGMYDEGSTEHFRQVSQRLVVGMDLAPVAKTTS